MDLNPFRDLGAREGDGLVMALELVLTTTLMAALGFWLDRSLGTLPVFTVVLGAFTLAYEVWKLVSDYGVTMDEHAQRRQPLRRGPLS